jgi:ABC-2 type transport system permease protein
MVKEFYQIVRDPSSILISIFLPLLLIFLYAYGVSLDLDHLQIGMVVEDTSADVDSLVQSFTNSPYFDVKFAHHQNAFIEDITSGRLRGFVVIPSYFTAFYKRPEANSAPLQVIADGSEPNTANFVQNYAVGAWQIWKTQQALRGQAPPNLVNVQPRFWFNEELESRNFLIPGSLGIIMTLIGTLLTALVVAREWERGTMEALMSTPISILEILIGKLIPYFFLAMFSLTICVFISVAFLGVPFRGSYLLLGVVASFFLFSALGVGLFISTVSKNQFVASQAAIVASFLPAFILSGFIFEISSMPLVIQWITLFIPARYFVSCVQTLFLAGNVWPLILYNLVPMFLVGLLFFGLTLFRSVKRLD